MANLTAQRNIRSSSIAKSFMHVISILEFCLCILFNMLVVLFFLRKGRRRLSSTQFLIVAVSVTDMFYTCSGVAAALITGIFSETSESAFSVINPIICQLMITFQFILIEASVLTRFLLSMARYAVITRNIKTINTGTMQKLLTFPIIKWMLFMVWTGSILVITIPKWLPPNSIFQQQNKTVLISCSILSSSKLSSDEKFYNFILSILTIVVPSLFILNNYVLILKHLSSSARRVSSYNGGHLAVAYAKLIMNQNRRTSINAIEKQMLRIYTLKRRRSQQRQLATTVMILSSTLIISYYPIVIINIAANFTTVSVSSLYVQVVLSISYLISIVAPMLLLVRNRKLQSYVKSWFKTNSVSPIDQ
ncbi:hypothetical protein TrispH2_009854 [Trichoplax sp. H2]|nr:hypothetical protein TrispH2_009854 [Trichoplax sp. H2]|eukprot:RDD38121.1 hypothetical protein TrispH2_009854 [Trichoplax sp. H2]